MAMNINSVVLSGTVASDPTIVGVGDGAWAFIQLSTVIGIRNPDGSFSDVDQIFQVVADVPHHVNTIKNWVKSGKSLGINGYLRNWEANGQQHQGVFISRITFAKPNRGGDADGAPPLPAQ